jgi:ATP-binding protein involved in chromosome partitioning
LGENAVNSYNLLIKEIKQKDNNTFSIKWNDDVIQVFGLGDLQSRCPCAKCVERKPEEDRGAFSENVVAKRIVNVGTYGLRIEFASGCSHGIYSFTFLREMLDEESI